MSSTPLIRLLLVGLLTGGASLASAAGLYNMPTNLRQCFGVGFGPGYHAPLLLGNPYHAGNEAKPIKWLPRGLAPPADHGFAATPSAWSGCPSGDCGIHEPAMETNWQGYTQHEVAPPIMQSAPMWSGTLSPPTLATPSLATPSLGSELGPEVIATPQPSR